MEFRPALICWRRLTNRRGAVFLLAVYFASLVLLVLGGISLQRTMTESRAALVSRDTQQAFFLAEGALDIALSQLRINDLADGCYSSGDTESCTQIPEIPSGTSFTLTTTGAHVVGSDTQEVTRQVVATGTAEGRSATVTATVSSQGPLKGVWTKGSIRVQGAGFGSGAFEGNVRSSLGTVEAIKLSSKINHVGQLQIAPSATTTEDVPFNDMAWQIPIGTNWHDRPGVYLQTSGGKTPTTSGEPAVVPMIPAAPIASPYTTAQCSGNVALTTAGQQLTIVDGNVNPLDLSGPNDNTIVLCLQYLRNDENTKVIFEAPATVYLTGSLTLEDKQYAVLNHGDLYTVEPGSMVPETAPLTPSGLKLIVTKAPESLAGDVTLKTTRFAGSVYAPESHVSLVTGYDHEYRLESIVGRSAYFLTFGLPMAINNDPADSDMAATTVTVQSWMSN